MKTIVHLLFVVAIGCGGVLRAQSQNGTIAGAIHDEQTGEEIIGANVLVVGAKLGAATDIDGKYLVKNVSTGAYEVRVSFVGYATKIITGAIIKAGEMLKLDVTISPVTVQADEVTVTAERVLATESALLSERKKASSIGDAISAEQIKRAPDATSGDALKRVTGIAIVDNKFVYIRGITDRYNNTTLNGSAVTSTEADKKGFSFDMLPSNLIENTVVVKSATPDLPGDFTGGLVQLNTLDFPDKLVAKLSVSSTYNSVTTSKDMLSAPGSGRDWLGFDSGTREYPGDKLNGVEFAKSLQNTWAPQHRRAPYNGSTALSYGDRFTVGDDQLGFIGSLSYKNGTQHQQTDLTDNIQGGSSRSFKGTSDEYAVLWGALANLSYKFGGAHKISFKNTFNQAAEDKTSFSDGYNGNNDEYVRNTTSFWSQRSVYSGQLSGDHNFQNLGGLDVQWKASVSSSSRRDPDRRSLEYARSASGDPSDPFIAKPGERSWTRLDEKIFAGGTDVSLPIQALRIKAGVSLETRERSYAVRYFQMDHRTVSPQNSSLFVLPIETIYAPENFGTGKFNVIEISKPSDRYSADQRLLATYIMADAPFAIGEQHFRFVGGARVENAAQSVTTTLSFSSTEPATVELKKSDVLPSLNLTYLFNDFTNLRLAYSQSVNRPEFRELSSVLFYDFDAYENVVGNPRLQRALARSYDVRLEVFPQPGEVLAFSYFQKRISNPIEQQLSYNGSPFRTWFNSDEAVNIGWEFELRKSLDFLGGYFTNFLVNVNYTRIHSKVEYDETVSNGQGGDLVVHSSRPLQGQSPYMINVSFLFTEPSIGTAINILYNRYGERLDAVVLGDGDVYEQPRDIVDLAITQPLFSGLEAKFTIKDIAGSNVIFTRRNETYRRITKGTTYGLSVSWNL